MTGESLPRQDDNKPVSLGRWQHGIVGGSILSFVTQVAIFLLYFPLSIILARTLLPSGRGEYALLVLVPTLLLLFLDPGLGNASVYLISQRRFHVGHAVPVLLVGAAMIGILGAVSFAVIVRFPILLASFGFGLAEHHVQLLWMCVALVPFLLVNQYFSSLLLSRHKILEFNIVRILAVAVQLMVILLLVALRSFDLFYAIVSYGIATLVTTGCTTWLMARTGEFSAVLPFSSVHYRFARDAVAYGTKGYLGRVLPFLGYRLDVFLIASLLSTSDLGVYAVAVALAERVWTVSDAVSTVLFPRIAASGDYDGVALTTQVCRHVLVVVGVVSLGLALVARPLTLLLYGPEYDRAALAFVALLPGTIAVSMSKVLSSYISGRGRPELGVSPAVVAVVVNLLLNLVMIPRLGIVGASLASTVSYVASAVLLIAYFVRLSDAHAIDLIAIRRADLVPYRRLVGVTYQGVVRQLARLRH